MSKSNGDARFHELLCAGVRGYYTLAEMQSHETALAAASIDLRDIFMFGPIPESMRGSTDAATAAQWSIFRLRHEPDAFYYAKITYADLKTILEGTPNTTPLTPVITPPLMTGAVGDNMQIPNEPKPATDLSEEDTSALHGE